ncbi:MAG: hypothetical protein GY719_36085 [bacterium]|nr:hypothetical protein [bacterium]
MRRVIVSLGMLVLLGTAPVFGEQVFGRFDGAGGDCDGPGTLCNAGSGVIGMIGWAIAETGIKRVLLLVDGVIVAQTTYGAPRPDVALTFPGFPDSNNPGWTHNLNSTRWANGNHLISARAETFGGTVFDLDNAHDIGFTNDPFILPPFGEIERPGRNEDVFGTCQRAACGNGVCEVGLKENCLTCPSDCNSQELGLLSDFCCGGGGGPNPIDCDDARCSLGAFTCSEEDRIRYTVVSGYSLDTGLTQEDEGVAWVELETNGAIVGNSRTSCVFDSSQGGLSNCYGLPRLDLEGRFPDVLDSPSAGFRFVLDVGGMIVNDLVTIGANTLTARSGDISNHFEDIDDVRLNFLCAEFVSEPSFGRIESPLDGRVYSGLLTFQGWALDGEGVDEVEVYVNGSKIDGTLYGPGLGTRPLVAAEYPGFQDTEAPVWRLSNFDTNQLSDGEHQVQVRVIDNDGDKVFIAGEVTFRVNNLANRFPIKPLVVALP